MQFQIPQFIDKETLLLGPLTVTQSGYIGGSIVGTLIMHGIFDGMIAWLFSILLFATAFALSFLKIEGQSFPKVIINFFSFTNSTKLYLWNMKFISSKILKIKKEEETIYEQKYTLSKERDSDKLHNLSFELEIKKQKNPEA